jgi:hypothetical protein
MTPPQPTEARNKKRICEVRLPSRCKKNAMNNRAFCQFHEDEAAKRVEKMREILARAK